MEKLEEQGDVLARNLLHNPIERLKLSLFVGLDDASFERLRNYRPLSFSGDRLPIPLQDALTRIVNYQAKEQEKGVEKARLENPDIPDYKASSVDLKQCHIRYFLQGEGAAVHLYALIGDTSGEYSLFFPRIGVNAGDWYEAWFMQTQKHLASNRRAVNRKLKRDVFISAKTWGEIAERIHSQTQLNLFTDAYEGPGYVDKSDTPKTHVFDAGTSFADALQSGREWRKLWWQEGALGNDILYRNATWYLFRGANNYSALMYRLKEKKTRKLPITLDDIAECLALSGTYIAWLEDCLGMDLFRAQSCISIFRLYNALSSPEKRLMHTTGLNKARLPSKMWSDFQDILDDMHASFTEHQKNSAVLMLDYKQGISRFVVKVQDELGLTQMQEIISLAAIPGMVLK